jgi:UDP-N-acetylmuramoyl-L-alanyl-D-glutamate--2,6-diaminopimelate ligase
MSAAAVPVRAVLDGLRQAGLLVAVSTDAPEHVAGIADDSRRVVRGGVFVAVPGITADGHRFIDAARAAGAGLVIAEDAGKCTGGPAAIVTDARRAAAVAAASFYGTPAASLKLVAVTGTNGKTTTVGILRHLLDEAADADLGRAASIGTLGVLMGSEGTPVEGGAGLTTPGPVELQRVLRALADGGARSVAMEVSSHSLAQHRVEGLRFDAAVFTNLTRDHLDYHDTMESYRDAKLSLATRLRPHGVAVVNADDEAWMPIRAGQFGRMGVLTFGTSHRAEVRCEGVAYSPQGTRFTLFSHGLKAAVSLPLIGDFNVVNALGAAAAALALGRAHREVAARLGTMPQVPGRLERVGEHPAVVRDYAHTPDALERALTALRPFVEGRLIVVFGAGGDRDPGKRPLMGAVAARLADVVVVTSDNPRTEDPERIIDQIVAGMDGAAHERIEDRRAAIARAITLADPAADLVLLAGKGHEDYQVRGTARLPFDEKMIVREILGAAGAARAS